MSSIKAIKVEVIKPLPTILKQYKGPRPAMIYALAPESPQERRTDWRAFEGVREP